MIMFTFRFSLVCAVIMAAALSLPAHTEPVNVDISPVSALDTASPLADGWQHGAFMEIFVRAYKDSDGDGMGDLLGLTQRLDYLRDLGVKGIWLMPITRSADGDHGYATTDFRSLDPAFGTLADFDELIRQAHARGIGIIMDYVINHSAATHPMFVSAASGKDQPFRDWFVWQDTTPVGWEIWGKNPWNPTAQGAYFGTFGPHMPDFNFRNPAVVKYHEDSLRYWLNRGLDGYRLDAVPHLIENSAKDWNDQPESRKLTNDLRRLITGYNKRFVVCEATAKPTDYASTDVCGSAFAFGHQYNIVKAAKGGPKAIQDVATYFNDAPLSMSTMVSNHDIFAGQRLWDQVDGNLAQYRLAAATYLLQPGTPFIYYGEEIGMGGVKELDGDQPLRTPMSWTADLKGAGFTTGHPFRPISPNAATQNADAQLHEPSSLFAFYQSMLRLRNTLPSIAQGSYEAPWVHGKAYGFQRTLGRETSLVLINYGSRSTRVAIKLRTSHGSWKPVFGSTTRPLKANAKGTLMIRIPAQSVKVFVRQDLGLTATDSSKR
jgi:glycosidase